MGARGGSTDGGDAVEGGAVGGAADEGDGGGGHPILPVDMHHLDLIDTINNGHTLAGESMNRLDAMMDWMGNGVNNLLLLKNYMLVNCNYGYSGRG